MLKGLRSAETAMNIQLSRMNVLANNLANVNTSGFKQVLSEVVEKVPSEAGRGAAGGAGTANVPTAATPTRGVRDLILDVRAPIDMTQGPLRETGEPTHVALRGEGFFKVQHNGREYFTRDGNFTIDARRRLVTQAGDPVLGSGGPIELPEGPLVIARDGTISVNGAQVGRLAVVTVEDPGRLNHIGGSLLAKPDKVAVRPLPPQEVQVEQGMLEESNADPVSTMVAMIAAQRAFQLESKVLQNADRVLGKAVNDLSRKA